MPSKDISGSSALSGLRLLELKRLDSPHVPESSPRDCALEPFVDANKAASFLGVKPRFLLDLARRGKVPSYPIGEGIRRIRRFRLSALAAAMEKHSDR
jgi:hypothetical protein